MAGSAAEPSSTAAASPPQPEGEESVHYLWREPQEQGAAATSAADANDAADAADAEAAAPSATPSSSRRPPTHHPDFDPWRLEAEREREHRERSRRAPLPARSIVRVLLWSHALVAALACCCGAAALLLATGFLLRRLAQPEPRGKSLHCYASSDPRALTVCEVATGLGALSTLAWSGFVVHFLYEASTAGGPPCLAVRPRYAQMALESVLGLAWGATAAGAISQKPGADAAGMPFFGARAALAGLAPTVALLFLVAAAHDAALVYFLSEGYHSGALRREGGIFCVMITPSQRGGVEGVEEGGQAAVGAGAGAGAGASGAGVARRRRAPPGLRFVTWAPGGGARPPAAASVGSSLELF